MHVRDIHTKEFGKKHHILVNKHRDIISFLKYNFDNKKLLEETNTFFAAVEFMKSFEIVNGPKWLNWAIITQKKVLAEGAQGSLLDVNFGSYPFVTSSNTTIGGVCTGLGIAPNHIGKVYGLFKAYCTRVGNGPFPTELGGKKSDEWCATKKMEDENTMYPDTDINNINPFIQGIALRRKGFEFGATTGRLRRTGWLDIPALQYACMINGVTDLIISKADILSGFETIEVCETHVQGDEYANQQVVLGNAVAVNPVYKKFPGWGDLTTIEKSADLPKEFKKYLTYITDKTGIPITLVSTGPDRKQILF